MIENELIDQCTYRLDESSRMVKKCLDQLSNDDVWKKPNESSNSIGNLILHLCGNITQYAISSLGATEDTRQRDKEFQVTEGFSKEQLFDKLTNTLDQAKRIMKQTSVDELLRKRLVQGFNMSGIGIIIHVTEHYSYHTGQIALLTKLWKNKDLGFYADIDLNVKNNG